jgi:hypothetical protein
MVELTSKPLSLFFELNVLRLFDFKRIPASILVAYILQVAMCAAWGALMGAIASFLFGATLGVTPLPTEIFAFAGSVSHIAKFHAELAAIFIFFLPSMIMGCFNSWVFRKLEC